MRQVDGAVGHRMRSTRQGLADGSAKRPVQKNVTWQQRSQLSAVSSHGFEFNSCVYTFSLSQCVFIQMGHKCLMTLKSKPVENKSVEDIKIVIVFGEGVFQNDSEQFIQS